MYTTAEFEKMRADIERLKDQVNGFVFGILDDQIKIDTKRNQELVQLASPLPCTFHRALDLVLNLFESTESIVQCGFAAILTSGGAENADSGAETVTELQQTFGDRVDFILGGRVRSTNVESLKQRTNVKWYHSAAITKPGEIVDADEVKRMRSMC